MTGSADAPLPPGSGTRDSGLMLLVTLEQLPPLRLHDLPHARQPDAGIPESVVVETRSHERPGRDRASEQNIFQGLERSMVDQLLAPARHRVLLLVEME